MLLGSATYRQPPAPDPLGHTEPLPLEKRFFPLGFPLDLRTNSSDVLMAGGEGWGEFFEAFDAPPIELRVIVSGDPAEPTRHSPAGPTFRAQGHLLALVEGPDNFTICDLDRGLGFGYLTPGVARNHLFAGFHFLDCMAYTCLCQRYLAPIHAACVAREGEGILLVGGPGAGKSSLAWACARAGLTFVSDDATWLLRSEPRLIGKSQRMRFRPEAVALIPDLVRLPHVQTVIGKNSFEIRTADVPGLVSANCCRPGKVVFLDRQPDGPAEFRPVGAAEAQQRMAEASMIYEPRVWREHEASRQQLTGCGALELRYSKLEDAAGRILELK